MLYLYQPQIGQVFIFKLIEFDVTAASLMKYFISGMQLLDTNIFQAYFIWIK